ncbi:MAG: SHOCT domain-containing protein [Candidatus Nanopelagicales bacterium]
MPGLIRGVARTAVIAGTATAVSNNVSRRQAGRWSDKEQQAQADAYAQQQYQQAQYAAQQPQYAPPPAPAAPAAPSTDLVAELTKLGELKGAGILTDAEFEAAKAKLLNG